MLSLFVKMVYVVHDALQSALAALFEDVMVAKEWLSQINYPRCSRSSGTISKWCGGVKIGAKCCILIVSLLISQGSLPLSDICSVWLYMILTVNLGHFSKRGIGLIYHVDDGPQLSVFDITISMLMRDKWMGLLIPIVELSVDDLDPMGLFPTSSFPATQEIGVHRVYPISYTLYVVS